MVRAPRLGFGGSTWTWMLPLLFGGCALAPDQGHDPGGIVMVAPPDAVGAETPGIDAPDGAAPVGTVWVAGYWDWVGDRYQWTPGRWVTPPHPGLHWVPHRWVRQGDGWRLRRGHWDRG